MNKLLCLLVFVLSLVIAACDSGGTKTQGRASEPVEQKAAPDLALTGLDGKTVNLSSLKGKVVMLNFWATWCPPCRDEIPSMMKLNAAFAGKPFQMLAVSIDEGGKQAVEEFFKNSGFSLPVYLDPSSSAGRTYGITGVPETFIIDKNGIIAKKVIGPVEWDSSEVRSYLEGLLK